jgi:hypothetical protein
MEYNEGGIPVKEGGIRPTLDDEAEMGGWTVPQSGRRGGKRILVTHCGNVNALMRDGLLDGWEAASLGEARGVIAPFSSQAGVSSD